MSHLSVQQLLGCHENHLALLPGHGNIKMHREVIAPLGELIKASQVAGFNLRVASGFRSFERQQLIWNKKCLGERPVLDADGFELDVNQLSAEQKIFAILRWSALPGASRHHWGSECDIYDAAAIDADYQLQLHPDEYTGNGPFAPMMVWLEQYLQQTSDFYRPYWDNPSNETLQGVSQRVAPEPWHLSYRPIALECEKQLSLSLLREHLQGEENLEEKQLLLAVLDKIYDRFVRLPNVGDEFEYRK